MAGVTEHMPESSDYIFYMPTNYNFNFWEFAKLNRLSFLDLPPYLH